MKDAATLPDAKSRKGIPFRGILIAVILGLIFLSSISTTLLIAVGLRRAFNKLLLDRTETTLDAVTERIKALFDPSDRLLETFSKKIRSGEFPIDDPLQAAGEIAAVLDFESEIHGIYFGYADGSLAGAKLEGTKSTPVVDASRWDWSGRDWFKRACASEGIVWTPPYKFADTEDWGISASEAVRAPDGKLLGVIVVDFLMKDVTGYLETLKRNYQVDAFVFSCPGTGRFDLLASSIGFDSPKALEKNPIFEWISGELNSGGPGSQPIEKGFPDGDTRIARMRDFTTPGAPRFVSACVFNRDEVYGKLNDAILTYSRLAGLGVLLLSLAAGYIVAGRIATPLRKFVSAVERIGQFDLSPQPMPRSSVREIRALGQAVDLMRSGLQSFARYVPMDLVRNLIHSGGVAELGGERRAVAVMFSDLAGFTAFSEHSGPEEAVETLTGYFEDFGKAIDANAGVIDKFIGDGMMALFNAPEKISSPAAAACRAALRGIGAMRARGSRFAVRVGLHFGECLVGNIGTPNRFTYTAIGDSVNLASRLEVLNKVYGTQIIASSVFAEAAGSDEFVWRWLDRVAVAGRSAPIDIHELLCFRDGAPAQSLLVADACSGAFAAYLEKDFARANQLLEPLVSFDGPSRVLRERIAREVSDPAATAGDGVNRFSKK